MCPDSSSFGKKRKTAHENQHLENASVNVRKKQKDALTSYSILIVNYFGISNFKFKYHENNPSVL